MLNQHELETILEKTYIILDEDDRANKFFVDEGFLWVSKFGSLPIQKLSLIESGKLLYSSENFKQTFTLLTILNTDHGDILQALKNCLEAMEMQEKRETGEFHINNLTAVKIWNEAKENARNIISRSI